MNVKELQGRMQDYVRFSIVLTTISVFLYIGVAFQNAGKASLQLYSMMGTTVLLLAFAIFFGFKARKIKQQLLEHEE
ncbi:hypothetical protein FIU87_14885 [Bacillus sp. THAF10]|uniref:YrhC family protein n=1 Tax=Bacillus sp. THAF10 TaxID=2587848 RepID=UPI0012A8DD7A|nr:YrhC family protein [Bacillus sp. THAF10]QFT89948.1 hypothetical protein FIU87_14885 [Bacillus sp. THAF10]